MLFELLFLLLSGYYGICSLVGSGELERLKRLALNFNRWCCQVTEEVGAGQGVSFGVKMKKGRVRPEGHRIIIESKRRIPHPLLPGHSFSGSCLILQGTVVSSTMWLQHGMLAFLLFISAWGVYGRPYAGQMPTMNMLTNFFLLIYCHLVYLLIIKSGALFSTLLPLFKWNNKLFVGQECSDGETQSMQRIILWDNWIKTIRLSNSKVYWSFLICFSLLGFPFLAIHLIPFNVFPHPPPRFKPLGIKLIKVEVTQI